MSKTNPYKKKRRQAKKTLLIFGEGRREQIFLRHLRKLYSLNSGVAITIRQGKGGDPLGKDTFWCKKKFESEYLNKKKKTKPNEYDKLFPKKLLNHKRLNVINLDKLISIMEGK